MHKYGHILDVLWLSFPLSGGGIFCFVFQSGLQGVHHVPEPVEVKCALFYDAGIQNAAASDTQPVEELLITHTLTLFFHSVRSVVWDTRILDWDKPLMWHPGPLESCFTSKLVCSVHNINKTMVRNVQKNHAIFVCIYIVYIDFVCKRNDPIMNCTRAHSVNAV